jgi:3-methyl-2-oxobutanoate hydroxymethyltransferase
VNAPLSPPRARTTLRDLADKKLRHEPIVMATAYDYVLASAASAAGVDIVLVGDSAATVMLGYAATREVTLDEMLMLTRAVRRGTDGPLLIGDLPYGTYESSDALAVETAKQFAAAGCDAVKMEGGGDTIARAAAVIAAGIPVMGHVGLTPQNLEPGEAARVHARSADAALRVLEDARALERVGCCALIFEAVPALVSEKLVPLIHIPVIGIGAGVATDGQVLVTYDLLGLTDGHIPKFVQRYADLKRDMIEAVQHYADDVRARRFPAREHTYGFDALEKEKLDHLLRSV